MKSGTKDPALGDPRLAYLLGHPLRARILVEIGNHPMELPELARALNEPLALVGYHHRVLVAAGLA